MATAARTKRPARRKPPRPRSTTSATTNQPPAAVVAAVYPEADPVVADARDRAADVADLVRDRARSESAHLLGHAEARAAALTEDARRQANAVRAATEAMAQQVLAEAVQESGRRLTEANSGAAAVQDRARSEAEQLHTEVRARADQHRAEAAAAAEQIEAQAQEQAQQLLTTARTAADEVLEQARREAARITEAADETVRRAEDTARGQLEAATAEAAEQVAAAERRSADVLAAAGAAATEVAERAESDAARLRERAATEAAQVREDAGRDEEGARLAAARVRKLAEEDIARLKATAAEDAERLTRSAREEADRIIAAARTRTETELKEVQETLAAARLREADAEVTLKAADDMVKEAGARMARAMDRTERRIERKRLKETARQERGTARDERKAKARQLRADARAGKPTRTERVKEFVRVNAERLMVVGPITAPMAVAWTGQAGFAEDILDWAVPFTILFAAAWELSTAFVGWMYHQARRGGDAGTLYRVSTWIFALGAAVMNFWHASGKPKPNSRVWDAKAEIWTEQITYWHFTPKAVAFAAMSIVGMVLWELYASLIHRRTLREDGKVAKARPSIGAVRWIRYPVHSWTAWSLAITDASLTTLDRAWAAADAELAVRETVRTAKSADRRAVRTGRALQRVVVPRVGAKAHGPEAIPSFLTITRTDRSGPGYGPAPVHPVQQERQAVRTGPADRNPVHGTVRTAASPDRTGGPPLALEAGPAGPHRADQETNPGPDRTAKSVPAAHANPAGRMVTVRTAAPHPMGDGPDRTAGTRLVRTGAEAGPDRTSNCAPDRTVIELTDLERTALDRLRTANEALNRNNIARAVRTEGGTIATDRAGQIAVALKQHAAL
ncbi:large Ala/Glu-rich protein [Streptomyces sp. W007]|uniref:hypothetical protein n=1 Tax=Streptomyces sp. W007 TaxID=1055352 RepID=UPI0002419BFB|nr:hypothetical protein [Streptomyces sp. W007]EHM31518.1 large Ala/Glu-rich protein [Streptomyces sp. W007]